MNQLLLIEDDKNLAASLSQFLRSEGFAVSEAQSLEAAQGYQGPFDVIILDWMLPDGQGIDYLKELRKNKVYTPVIMLTARNELIDKVLGLESGANDYLTKPFEPRELVARIRVQMRARSSAPTDSSAIIERGPLTIDKEQREVVYKEEKVVLTKMEYDLLVLLADSPGRAFSRDELLNKVWGFDNFPSTRTVDTHVLQLRQKLDENLIETVRGIGYKFRTPEKS